MSAGTVSVELERSPVGMGFRKVSQWIKYSDFTDSAGVTGTLTMTNQIPVGAFVVATKVYVKTAFTGGANTTCTLMAGITSTGHEYADAADISIYTAGKKGDAADMSFISTAQSVYLVATASADWTTISAGQMFVEVFYLSTEVDLTSEYQDKGNPDL